jgi:hypothetical protein
MGREVTKPLDRDLIARAMKRAAQIATNGTPEQRAGMSHKRSPKQAIR